MANEIIKIGDSNMFLGYLEFKSNKIYNKFW